jgi:hypothetical protein
MMVRYMFAAGEIEWETSEVEGEISELSAGSAMAGASSVLMLEGMSVPALGMDSSYGENSLALTIPQRDMVVVSSPDSEYTGCYSCVVHFTGRIMKNELLPHSCLILKMCPYHNIPYNTKPIFPVSPM